VKKIKTEYQNADDFFNKLNSLFSENTASPKKSSYNRILKSLKKEAEKAGKSEISAIAQKTANPEFSASSEKSRSEVSSGSYATLYKINKIIPYSAAALLPVVFIPLIYTIFFNLFNYKSVSDYTLPTSCTEGFRLDSFTGDPDFLNLNHPLQKGDKIRNTDIRLNKESQIVIALPIEYTNNQNSGNSGNISQFAGKRQILKGPGLFFVSDCGYKVNLAFGKVLVLTDENSDSLNSGIENSSDGSYISDQSINKPNIVWTTDNTSYTMTGTNAVLFVESTGNESLVVHSGSFEAVTLNSENGESAIRITAGQKLAVNPADQKYSVEKVPFPGNASVEAALDFSVRNSHNAILLKRLRDSYRKSICSFSASDPVMTITLKDGRILSGKIHLTEKESCIINQKTHLTEIIGNSRIDKIIP
jgi:hypothetical protein